MRFLANIWLEFNFCRKILLGVNIRFARVQIPLCEVFLRKGKRIILISKLTLKIIHKAHINRRVD
jgi:hypothetical protein